MGTHSKYNNGVKALLDRGPYGQGMVKLLAKYLSKDPKDIYRYLAGAVKWDVNHVYPIQLFLLDHGVEVEVNEVLDAILIDRNRKRGQSYD